MKLDATQERLTFVTVAHGDDFGLLRLQAKSMAMYLDRTSTAQILVVENPTKSERLDWRTQLLEDYGALAAKVQFVRADEIASIPHGVSGWFSQQILKLMISVVVPTEKYAVLDAKNHLVYPLAGDYFIGPSGRLRSYLMNYRTHPMRDFLESTLTSFGLKLEGNVEGFLPTTTPFGLPTSFTRELVQRLSALDGMPFPEAFINRGYKRTEFFTVGAYILANHRSFDELFEFSGSKSPAIWPDSNSGDCLDAIASSEYSTCPVFSVHRRSFRTLDPTARSALGAYWVKRALFSSLATSLDFLSDVDEPRSGSFHF